MAIDLKESFPGLDLRNASLRDLLNFPVTGVQSPHNRAAIVEGILAVNEPLGHQLEDFYFGTRHNPLPSTQESPLGEAEPVSATVLTSRCIDRIRVAVGHMWEALYSIDRVDPHVTSEATRSEIDQYLEGLLRHLDGKFLRCGSVSPETIHRASTDAAHLANVSGELHRKHGFKVAGSWHTGLVNLAQHLTILSQRV